ncbi:hypothetical protein KIL84_009325 [Mauremys mutica]|uniref:Uncharacterized protein n=1 Tax=Mauremys mutica TaxID=74926 RepID=A0A9D3XFC7_9SAUR|nr:hypothetical protein KIL84_009325 [Mauremys mutica]
MLAKPKLKGKSLSEDLRLCHNFHHLAVLPFSKEHREQHPCQGITAPKTGEPHQQSTVQERPQRAPWILLPSQHFAGGRGKTGTSPNQCTGHTSRDHLSVPAAAGGLAPRNGMKPFTWGIRACLRLSNPCQAGEAPQLQTLSAAIM